MSNYRKRILASYTVHTATRAYQCLACGRQIEPGEQYTRRRRRSGQGQYMTIAKCSECVPIRES